MLECRVLELREPFEEERRLSGRAFNRVNLSWELAELGDKENLPCSMTSSPDSLFRCSCYKIGEVGRLGFVESCCNGFRTTRQICATSAIELECDFADIFR